LKRVLLLIPKGSEVLEMATFYDVLGWASLEGTEKIEVTTVGLTDEVTCTFGLRVVPDKRLDEVRADDFDALALPGGFEEYGFYDEAFSEPVADLLRTFAAQSKPIATICVGALPLANSGLLRDRCATTYALSGGKRRTQLAEFGAQVEDEPIVRDKLLITSTGPATAPDVALLLVEMLTDAKNADHIRHLMGYPPLDRAD